MRRLAPLLLALAACSEPSGLKEAPTDRFAFPATLALTARQDGGNALIVASGNYDLTYEGAGGGTVLSVDPALAADQGSATAGGGPLVKYGEGMHVGSYAGQLVVADAATCPGTGTAARPPEVLLATRFSDQVWRLPLDLNGRLDPCQGSLCVAPIDGRLRDPFSLALACRPDGQRRTAFVSYLRPVDLDGAGLTGWLAELDLQDASAPARTTALGSSPLAGMAYDDRTDQLFLLGQPLLSSPVYILDLFPCPAGAALADCPRPTITAVDLNSELLGLELQAIALSNHQAGLGRRAYVTARVYDPILADLIQARPTFDVAGMLLVLDLEPGTNGRPSLRVLHAAYTGLGASQVQVLPVRAPVGGVPRRDVVVVSSINDGTVTVFDDDRTEVVRVIPIDPATGAPEVGRSPFGLATERLAGATPADDVARVYVAASRQQVVGIVDVPLDAPGQAHVLRDAAGTLVRIGGLQ